MNGGRRVCLRISLGSEAMGIFCINLLGDANYSLSFRAVTENPDHICGDNATGSNFLQIPD